MSRVFKPDSGQSLVLQDEGGSAALTIDTDGNTQFSGNGAFSGNELNLSNATAPTLSITDTTNTVTSFVKSGDSESQFGTSTNHIFKILTNNTDRITVDTNGDVGIGVAPTSTIRLNVKDDYASSSSNYIFYGWDSGDNARFYVKTDGTLWSSNGGTSDEREKESIVDFKVGLDKVLKLKTKSFRWKINNENLFHGFIAQDVIKHIPELIHGDPSNEDARLQLDYNGITCLLVNAVQELSAKVTALENA